MNWWATGIFLMAWLLSVIAVVGVDIALLFTRVKTETVMMAGTILTVVAGSWSFAEGSHALALGFAFASVCLVALLIDAERHTLAHRRKIGKRTDVYYDD